MVVSHILLANFWLKEELVAGKCVLRPLRQSQSSSTPTNLYQPAYSKKRAGHVDKGPDCCSAPQIFQTGASIRNGSSHGGREERSGSCLIEGYVGTWLKCSSAVSSGYKDSRDGSGTRLVTRLCVFPYVAVQNTSCYFRFHPSALIYAKTELGDEKEQMLIERGVTVSPTPP